MKPGLLLILTTVIVLLLVGVVIRFRTPEATSQSGVDPASIAVLEKHSSLPAADTEIPGLGRSAQAVIPETRSGSVTCLVLDESGQPRSGVELWLLQHSKTPRNQRLLRELRFSSAAASAFDDPKMQRRTDADGLAVWEGIQPGDGYYLYSPLGKALVFASSPKLSDFITHNGVPQPNPDVVDGAGGPFAVRHGESYNESAAHMGSCTLVGQVPECAVAPESRRHRLQMTVFSHVDGNTIVEAQLVEGLASDHSFTMGGITPGEKVLQIVWGDSNDHYFFIQRCLELRAGEKSDCGAMRTARVPARRFTVELVDHDGLALSADKVFSHIELADPQAHAVRNSYAEMRDLVEGDDPHVLLRLRCETPTQESGCSLAKNNASIPIDTWIAPIVGRECTLHGVTDIPDRPIWTHMESGVVGWRRGFSLLPGYSLQVTNRYPEIAVTAEPQRLPIQVLRMRELRVQIGNPLMTARNESRLVSIWIQDPDSGREIVRRAVTYSPDKKGGVKPIEESFSLPVSIRQVRITCTICKHDESMGCDVPGSPGLYSDVILTLEPTVEEVTHVPEWKGAVGLSGTLVTPNGDPMAGESVMVFLELASQTGESRSPVLSKNSLDHLRQISTRTNGQGRFFYGALPPGSRVSYPEIFRTNRFRMVPLHLDEAGSVYSTVITSLDPGYMEVPK